MKDVKEKIRYIYFNIDGIYYFLSNPGITDHSKRCILRRFFILVDSYFEMIGFLKNTMFKDGVVNLSIRHSLEKSIEEIKSEWDNNYEIIRNKFAAHQQDIDDAILLEWWNEIDYTTVTYYYEGLSKIRAILVEASIFTIMPIDYSEIDFSGSYLEEKDHNTYYMALDRLAQSRQNTIGINCADEFQRKCMLILSAVDFCFINLTLTVKTQEYKTNYNNILFDTAWLLICCDTISIIENMYEDGDYGKSLLSLSPTSWKGKPIIEVSNSKRDKVFEESLKNLRNKFAAHIDTRENFYTLMDLFANYDLRHMYEYCMTLIQSFQLASRSDRRSNMFASLDQKLSGDILGIAHSEHRSIDR